MIHELIDQKKKSIKQNTTKNIKTLNDNKTSCENNIRYEQSDNENKEAESQSNTFIPPWLRNSLGLNQRHNQNLDWSVCLPNFTALGHAISDQKSSKAIPRFKDQNHKESDGAKSNVDAKSSINVNSNLENLQKDCRGEVNNEQRLDAAPSCHYEKTTTLLWSNNQKGSESESVCANSEIKMAKNEDWKSHMDCVLPNERYREEDKRRLRMVRQKNKIRKKNVVESSGDFGKSEVDHLLEVKAKEVLDNYGKKDVHSVSSDIKQIEAKLILLGIKCREADPSKFSQQELRLLQEIKEQTGNREEFQKLMSHIRESNLREWLKIPENSYKSIEEKIKQEEMKLEKNAKESFKCVKYRNEDKKIISDKESIKSTDDENDIKRFSEFLSKNKNLDEKRKCLEEVRNYFERKRRTRLTKRRYNDDSKFHKYDDFVSNKKEDITEEKSITKEIATVFSGKEKKSKFVPCNEEVVEKAVSETLQKFMNLYHFHVSPAMMGNMRKNILQAIQTDSTEKKFPKKNISEECLTNKNLEETHLLKKNEEDNGKREEPQKKTQRPLIDPRQSDQLEVIYTSDCKGFNQSSFKTLVESSKEQLTQSKAENPGIENDVDENENFKRLKIEFESCLKTIQVQADGSELKIQSLVFEKGGTDLSKGLLFVYNFSNKSLQLLQAEDNLNKSGDYETKEETFLDRDTQTIEQSDILKKSVRSQTTNEKLEVREKSLQTDDKTYTTNYAQTAFDENELNELNEIKDFDISPGLYRMVKSKDIGRFYLYPEKLDESKVETLSNKESSSAIKWIKNRKPSHPKLLSKVRPTKQIRYSFKDRGKFRRIKKKNRIAAQKRKKKQEADIKTGNSVSYLFLRNNKQSSLAQESQENKELSLRNDVNSDTSKDNHLGCFWFWNGKKIATGSDLKMHVEDLLREKLKEICYIQNQITERPLAICPTKNEPNANHVMQSKGSLKILQRRSTNPTFNLRMDNATKINPSAFSSNIQLESIKKKTNNQTDENMTNDKAEDSIMINEKSVRDVGTQNSQQTFLSLNISKMKSRSKTSTKSKMSTVMHKRNVFIKPYHETKGVLSLKAIENLVTAIREIRKVQCQADNEDVIIDSSSCLDDSTSSSTIKNDFENSLSSVLEMKNQPEIKVDFSNKVKQILNSVDQENQSSDDYNFEKNSSFEKLGRDTEIVSKQHWDIIENVLNRVSAKERKSLWNDIRRFIKKKIGRDINDEGAREVCIEIEQDMPKTKLGKEKPSVMAKGHYVGNDGDLEVEIDLTLDDLERILRQRHKKIQKRQMFNTYRTKKLLSSSSAQSGLAKNELRKYGKYLHKCSFSRGFETGKKFKMFTKK